MAKRNGWYALVCQGPRKGQRKFADSFGGAQKIAHDLLVQYGVQVDVGLMPDGKQDLFGVFRPGRRYKALRQ